VRSLALQAGFNHDLLATPAIALGAYVATPLEVAGAYTIFANGGQYVGPRSILAVKDAAGTTLWQSPESTRWVLDRRVAYLMTNLMESVINSGTAAGVRGRGFVLPAAGKTGTSHDGWFAGFTSNLLAVVWVGYDDDRELVLSGASSALPVWTDFMKRATALAAYRKVAPFTPPPGIVTVPVTIQEDPTGSEVAMTVTREEAFIEGTEPKVAGLGGKLEKLAGLLHKILPLGEAPASAGMSSSAPPPPQTAASTGTSAPPTANAGTTAQESPAQPPEKKKGIVRKIFSVFKHGGSKPTTDEPNQQ